GTLLPMGKGGVGAQASGLTFGDLGLQGRFPGQYPLSVRPQALWEEIEDLIGDRCEFDPSGHLYSAFNDTEREKLEKYAAVSESHGLAIEHLGTADLARRYPWL